MDASSNDAKFSVATMPNACRHFDSSDEQTGIHHPIRLATLVGHTQDYAGVFVPGGHAPMVDLVSDNSLGVIWSFHESGRPTVLVWRLLHGSAVCHARLEKFKQALITGNSSALPESAHGWPYARIMASAIF